jgi:hypothetical protein
MKVAATTTNKQKQSRAVANNVSHHKSNSRGDSGFVDNRPETKALKSLQMMINDSPRMVAQRQRKSNIYGGTAQVIKGPDTNVPNGPAKSSKFIRLSAPSPVCPVWDHEAGSMGAKPSQMTRRGQYKADRRADRAKAGQSTNASTVQRAPTRTQTQKSPTTYTVEYTGEAQDFTMGEDADAWGIQDVESYQAEVEIDNVYDDGSAYEDDVSVDAATHEYHYGHMLAAGLGGTGDLNNVFEQDGGQNTQGDWPSFERSAQGARNSADDDSDMRYTVTLNGTNLNYHF